MRNRTSLPRLAGKLQAHTHQRPPSYRQLYQMVVDGQIPAKYEGGRIYVDDIDIPGIAELLGLTDTLTAA